MPEDFVHLIDNPWPELDRERARNLWLVKEVLRMLERGKVMDGRSAISSKICKLCQDIPSGKNLSYRQDCPLHTVAEHMAEELKRLSTPYRRQVKKVGVEALAG